MENYNNNDAVNIFEQKDISDNKAYAILAYIGILVLVPILAAKDSKFARFHANQGLVLFLTEMAYAIAYRILIFVFGFIPIIGRLMVVTLSIPSLLFLALAIIGIINAAQGTGKELPIIGKITILK